MSVPRMPEAARFTVRERWGRGDGTNSSLFSRVSASPSCLGERENNRLRRMTRLYRPKIGADTVLTMNLETVVYEHGIELQVTFLRPHGLHLPCVYKAKYVRFFGATRICC
ncbi:hypothetical protein AAFF_G00386160 [Aldrovandia affinis]|uniref:Uncharacterized protein n=1 Tax=Aldrovandia affinis TaxID=143900 RepID=A0AAD7WLR8_9TELE|nr:hypothetical protein AAFF_G00386160 [Aldrovandia affinis]